MKKLILIAMAITLMAMPLQAAVTTTIEIPAYQLSSDYTYISIPFDLSDTTTTEKRFLYLATGTGAFALKDSIYASFTDPDTFKVAGLMNGTTYRFYITVRDTAGNDSTIISSALQGTYSTTDFTQVLGDSAITHEGAYVYWDSVMADTGVAELWLLYDLTVAGCTTKSSTDTVDFTTAADTFVALSGLEEGALYYYKWVALDSALQDTSATGTFTTLDLTGTMTVALVSGTPTSIAISVEIDTSSDFNGVDTVNIFEGTAADSLTDVATLTVVETLTVTWDTTVVYACDSVIYYWGTVRDSVLEHFTNNATDTSLADTGISQVVKSSLIADTKYYFAARACSVDVWDSVAIDSVTTGHTVYVTRTGKLRGGQYHYWAQVFDSIYCDSIANDSITVPLLATWGTSDLIMAWDNPTYLPSQPYDVSGIETIYYNCWLTGATFRTKDSLKVMVYDETWGLSTPIDSSGFIVTDTLTIAVDSVACNNKDLITFAVVARHPTQIDDIVGKLQLNIEIQERPF